jgi:hypothetical protein
MNCASPGRCNHVEDGPDVGAAALTYATPSTVQAFDARPAASEPGTGRRVGDGATMDGGGASAACTRVPSPWVAAMMTGERAAGASAGLLFALAVLGFGTGLDGYSHRLLPLGVLGARGVPNATVFNYAAFVLPGTLAAVLAWWRRGGLALAAGWPARLGVGMVFLSAIAFVVQGLLPLDLTSLDARASRLHAAAWTLWWVSFVPGALLLAAAPAGAPAQTRPSKFVHAASALLVLALAALWPEIAGAALAQRLAFATWFAWLAWWPWQWTPVPGPSRAGS